MCGIKFWKGNENQRYEHPKKVVAKNYLPVENLPVSSKTGFLAKLLLGALFTKGIRTYSKSVGKYGFFDTPFDLVREKVFIS
jgi:hypothetical protein